MNPETSTKRNHRLTLVNHIDSRQGRTVRLSELNHDLVYDLRIDVSFLTEVYWRNKSVNEIEEILNSENYIDRPVYAVPLRRK